jgi:hypothetical protein
VSPRRQTRPDRRSAPRGPILPRAALEGCGSMPRPRVPDRSQRVVPCASSYLRVTGGASDFIWLEPRSPALTACGERPRARPRQPATGRWAHLRHGSAEQVGDRAIEGEIWRRRRRSRGRAKGVEVTLTSRAALGSVPAARRGTRRRVGLASIPRRDRRDRAADASPGAEGLRTVSSRVRRRPPRRYADARAPQARGYGYGADAACRPTW